MRQDMGMSALEPMNEGLLLCAICCFVCQLGRGMQSISVGTLIGVAWCVQQVRDASNKQTSCVMSWCGRCGSQDGSSNTMVWVSAMLAAVCTPITNIEWDSKLGVLRVAFNASGAPRWSVQMCHGVCPFGGGGE